MLDACWSLRGLRHRIMGVEVKESGCPSFALSRVRPESAPIVAANGDSEGN